MKKTILIFGWYNNGNAGDRLFKEAFALFFPDYNLVFTPRITISLLKDASAVFIGGGSFLFAPLDIENGAIDILKQKKLFYIGVGAETDIHPIHKELMAQAKLIAIRSIINFNEVKAINNNTICLPDIVYCLQSLVQKNTTKDKSILILPNFAVVPQWDEPHWKHVAWEYFKSEFSQFLDYLIDEKYTIKFLAMCQNKKTNDHWAATEIINKMKNRGDNYLLDINPCDIKYITSIISQYQTVITQRFHGIVLADMLNIPSVIISHHDKLKNSSSANGVCIPYYGLNKTLLIDSFNSVQNNFNILPIENNIFEELIKSVSDLIDNG